MGLRKSLVNAPHWQKRPRVADSLGVIHRDCEQCRFCTAIYGRFSPKAIFGPAFMPGLWWSRTASQIPIPAAAFDSGRNGDSSDLTDRLHRTRGKPRAEDRCAAKGRKRPCNPLHVDHAGLLD